MARLTPRSVTTHMSCTCPSSSTAETGERRRRERFEEGLHPLFGVGVESVNLADVRTGRLHQPESIRLGLSKRVLVSEDFAVGEGTQPAASHQSDEVFAGAVGQRVALPHDVIGRLALVDEDTLSPP